MLPLHPIAFSRRSFIALSAALPWAFRGLVSGSTYYIPVGLELYSVRDELKKDPQATVRSGKDGISAGGVLCALLRMDRGPGERHAQAAGRSQDPLLLDA